jgi:hypothetical protein
MAKIKNNGRFLCYDKKTNIYTSQQQISGTSGRISVYCTVIYSCYGGLIVDKAGFKYPFLPYLCHPK